MLIINNRFLSLYDYNFLLVIEKIFSVNSKICGSMIRISVLYFDDPQIHREYDLVLRGALFSGRNFLSLV